MAEQGLVLLNASLIDENPSRTDVELLQVPVVELAHEVGSDMAGNMVMIGAFCAKTRLLSIEEAIIGMEAALKGKEKYFQLNQRAIERGFAFVANGT